MKRWFRWAAVCLLALALLAACALAETREEKYTQDGWDYCDSYEDDTLVQRTRTQALEDGTRCEERYNLVAGKLTLVRKNLLDADGNRLSGSVAYNYDYNTGDYQGRGECAGLDEEGREVWKEYDDADVFTGEVKQWQDEDGRFYVAQYDADGKLYARHAREWLEDGGCNETSEALVAGELKVVSKDIYDANGNRQPGSIDYHYDDATGAYQGRTEYQGVNSWGRVEWKTYDENGAYQYRRESWKNGQDHFENYYDAKGFLVEKCRQCVIGYRRAYLLDAALGAAALVLALRLRETRPASSGEGVRARLTACVRESLRFLLGDARVVRLILLNAAVGALATLLRFFLQARLTGAGMPDGLIGPALFVIGMGGAVGARFAAGLRSWRYRRVWLLTAAGTLLCTALSLLHSWYLMLSCGFCAALLDDLLEVCTDVRLNEAVPSAQRATLISVASLSFSLVMIGLSPALGWLFEAL